jgi:hypothetical protein
MNSNSDFPSLANLEFMPYIDEGGELPQELSGQIGVYAIYDRDRVLQFVGYSRDIYLSLKQHLVRQVDSCYWVKYHAIERPSRIFLETVRDAWISENGDNPIGNGTAASSWLDPIATQQTMTPTERESLDDLDELGQIKLLKQVARRVEETILNQLKARGIKTEIRFNPKLKEQGLLDLK